MSICYFPKLNDCGTHSIISHSQDYCILLILFVACLCIDFHTRSPVQTAFRHCIISESETVFSLPRIRPYNLVINLDELRNKKNIVSHHHSNMLSLISLAKGQGSLASVEAFQDQSYCLSTHPQRGTLTPEGHLGFLHDIV